MLDKPSSRAGEAIPVRKPPGGSPAVPVILCGGS
jgi:hypothetical protein